MALAPLRATLYDLKTGNYLRRVPVKTAPWSKELNAWGQYTITLPRSTSANLPLLRSLAQPWRTLAILTRGNRVIQGGPVTARPFGDALVLKGEGFGAVFRKRLVLNRDLRGRTLDGEVLIDEDNPAPEWRLTFTGSYVDIAARLIAETYEWGALPVTIPGYEGGAMTRTYYGYDFATVEERLTELTQLEDGPELRFRGELVPGGVLFNMEGDTELVSKHHRWNTNIPGDRCTIGQIDDDGEHIVTEQWMLGGRNEDLMLVTRKRDGEPITSARNRIHDPRVSNLSTYSAAGCDLTKYTVFPGPIQGITHNSLLLSNPTSTNSYADVGGVGMVLGTEVGKTYTFSATGSVRSKVGGAPDPDGRTRRLVVMAFIDGEWVYIAKSPRIPPTVQTGASEGTRVRATFTVPEGTTGIRLRFYLGHTVGSIAWSQPRFSQNNADPNVDNAEYFWGSKPNVSRYAYSYEGAEYESASIRTALLTPQPALEGYPLLQAVDTSHSTVSDIRTLRGYAREALLRGARTQEVIDVHVSAEEDVEPGDWADVRTTHPLFGDVVLPLKVLAVSGDTGARIKLSCRIRNGETV